MIRSSGTGSGCVARYFSTWSARVAAGTCPMGGQRTERESAIARSRHCRWVPGGRTLTRPWRVEVPMLRRRRSAFLTVLAVLVLGATSLVLGVPDATAVDPDPHLWQGTRTGPQVLRQHPEHVDSIAARNGIPRASVRRVLEDASSRVNGLG